MFYKEEEEEEEEEEKKKKKGRFRAQQLCQSRGGRPGLPVLDRPYNLCGCKATVN